MTISRRDFLEFLQGACTVAALPASLLAKTIDQQAAPINTAPQSNASAEILVNDIHSQLSRTRVSAVYTPNTVRDLRAIIQTAKTSRSPVSICGRRHSMGGQQFGTDNMLVDMTSMNRLLDFDKERGIVEIEAGIEWPQLLDYLKKN